MPVVMGRIEGRSRSRGDGYGMPRVNQTCRNIEAPILFSVESMPVGPHISGYKFVARSIITRKVLLGVLLR